MKDRIFFLFCQCTLLQQKKEVSSRKVHSSSQTTKITHNRSKRAFRWRMIVGEEEKSLMNQKVGPRASEGDE
jgi:hypothetical protein